jgi:cysteine desulfurase
MTQKSKKNNIYFDYAATTPVDQRVLKSMLPYFSEKYGNTMSFHSLGQQARQDLEQAREKVSKLINSQPEEIIFTSSATESNNLALKGICFANQKKGNHIIISSIEHPCIIESVKWLEKNGFKVTKISVDQYGLINLDELKDKINKRTILVSITHASNEIGTIQPIEKIAKICQERKVLFHTDAVQSFARIPINVNKIKIDLLTASSHKIYGPKGAGLLFVRKNTKIIPLLHGGGQEFNLRSSTINMPAVVGFSKAVEIAEKEMAKDNEKLIKLRDKLIKQVLDKIPGSYLNGHPKNRLNNNANFRFDFVEGESIIMQLDLFGIAASTGSACSSIKLEPSHVLMATGLKHEQAHGSLRISLGKWTTENEINYLLKVLPGIIENLRKISGKLGK